MTSSELARVISPQDEPTDALFATLPLLLVERANLPGTAKQLAAYLETAGHLFQRGSQVVRVVNTAEGIRIERLNPDSLVLEAHKVCQPAEDKRRRGRMVREKVTLPTQVARLYLNLGEDLNLPVLKGICAAPLLSDDGSINCWASYDKASGLWCTGVDTPAVSPAPTREEATNALRAIRMLFASFPFADSDRLDTNFGSLVSPSKDAGADESTFLIALLTAICRPSLLLC